MTPHVNPLVGIDKVTKNALVFSVLGAVAGGVYALATHQLTVPLGMGCGFVGGVIGGLARGLIMALPRLK